MVLFASLILVFPCKPHQPTVMLLTSNRCCTFVLLRLLLSFRPCSPLHYAAWGGHAHIIRKLLAATTVSDRLLVQGCTDNYDRCRMTQRVGLKVLTGDQLTARLFCCRLWSCLRPVSLWPQLFGVTGNLAAASLPWLVADIVHLCTVGTCQQSFVMVGVKATSSWNKPGYIGVMHGHVIFTCWL